MDNNKSFKVDLFKKMLLIRFTEIKVNELADKRVIPRGIHLGIGQEAVAVGVCAALRDTDMITTQHRSDTHVIAKGADLKSVMAEFLGKESGLCGGRGGQMHFSDIDRGIFGATGVIGGITPAACGLALAFKLMKSDRVVVWFGGDGAYNQGAVLECLNLAALWKLPVIFVYEDNQYAISTRVLSPTNIQPAYSTAKDIVLRSMGFGIPGITVDGNNVMEVYRVASAMIEKARIGEGPFLMDCKTYRLAGHYIIDPAHKYRSKEEEEEWKRRDPILKFKVELTNEGVLTEDDIKKIEDEIRKIVNEAVETAQQESDADPNELFKEAI